jgi:hypothetical protein
LIFNKPEQELNNMLLDAGVCFYSHKQEINKSKYTVKSSNISATFSFIVTTKDGSLLHDFIGKTNELLDWGNNGIASNTMKQKTNSFNFFSDNGIAIFEKKNKAMVVFINGCYRVIFK